jgi:hypothetical protein
MCSSARTWQPWRRRACVGWRIVDLAAGVCGRSQPPGARDCLIVSGWSLVARVGWGVQVGAAAGVPP